MMARRASIVALAFIGMLAAHVSDAAACQIPVFRYALERWAPEPLEIVIFHRGPLTKAQEASISALGGDAKSPANTSVTPVDVDGKLTGQAAKLWSAQPDAAKAALPWMVVRPADGEEKHGPIWAGPLSDDAAKMLVDSPIRRQLAERLLKAETAVWVLVESGDKTRDAEAAKTLTAELERQQKELKVAAFDPDIPGPRLLSNLPLRVAFSVVRVSRADPAERLLVSMLTRGVKQEKDAPAAPVAVPVFGQGRALIQLTDKEIAKDEIEQVSRFLIGECSCQVKELNPGFDLLMSADWSSIREAGVTEPKKIEVPDPVIGSGKPK
jgi:hypothetical protein